jgi:hypothetical protein
MAQQCQASGTFLAAAAGSISLPAITGMRTVLTGVTLTCGVATGTVHGIWTVTDGTWSQSYYIMMSATIIPAPVDLTLQPGVYASAFGTAITISVPAITSGAPYALSAQGYYTTD